MENIVYLTVMTVMTFVILLMTRCLNNRIEVAKAGNIHDKAARYAYIRNIDTRNANIGGKRVCLDEYDKISVAGDSMQMYHIHNGNIAFIKKFNDEEKESICTRPVVVITIPGAKSNESRLKLRKFITYIDNISSVRWEDVYEANRTYIRLEKETFCHEIAKKCMDERRVNGDCRYVLSETYDSKRMSVRYSLHPVARLYAKVKYVI